MATIGDEIDIHWHHRTGPKMMKLDAIWTTRMTIVTALSTSQKSFPGRSAIRQLEFMVGQHQSAHHHINVSATPFDVDYSKRFAQYNTFSVAGGLVTGARFRAVLLAGPWQKSKTVGPVSIGLRSSGCENFFPIKPTRVGWPPPEAAVSGFMVGSSFLSQPNGCEPALWWLGLICGWLVVAYRSLYTFVLCATQLPLSEKPTTHYLWLGPCQT